MEQKKRFLTAKEAATYLRVSKGFLDKRRMYGREGEGPRFIRVSVRKILYDIDDLDQWVEAQRRKAAGGKAA